MINLKNKYLRYNDDNVEIIDHIDNLEIFVEKIKRLNNYDCFGKNNNLIFINIITKVDKLDLIASNITKTLKDHIIKYTNKESIFYDEIFIKNIDLNNIKYIIQTILDYNSVSKEYYFVNNGYVILDLENVEILQKDLC